MIKCSIMIGMSVLTPYLAFATHFPEGKYIGIIFFGYGCNCLWKTKAQMAEEKLKKECELSGKPYEEPVRDHEYIENEELRKPEQYLA